MKATAGAGELKLGIRPEFLRRVPEGTPGSVRVEVAQVEDLGRYRIATTRLGAQEVKVRLAEEVRVAAGESCWLEFPAQWTTLYVGGRAVS
jgi:glycerol transport system ATP-binding protein